MRNRRAVTLTTALMATALCWASTATNAQTADQLNALSLEAAQSGQTYMQILSNGANRTPAMGCARGCKPAPKPSSSSTPPVAPNQFGGAGNQAADDQMKPIMNGTAPGVPGQAGSGAVPGQAAGGIRAGAGKQQGAQK